jgi:uncharacterized membrane protein
MVVGTIQNHSENARKTLMITFIMLLVGVSPLLTSNNLIMTEDDNESIRNTSHNSVDVWSDGGQAWPQFGRTGDRIGDIPLHSPEGGAGFEDPNNSSELMSIIDPKINWEYGSYEIGNDALATPIANFENSITKDVEASERCGEDSLFLIIIQTEVVSGSDHSFLRIIEGEDSDLAWQVDLGMTERIKTSPVIIDLDEDGKQEIIIAYDAGGSVFVEAWSPRLSCSVTGWSSGSHSSELLWTWSDETLLIGSQEGPYTSDLLGGHNPTTQLLLADIDLDGDAELILTLINQITDEPVVLALPLPSSSVPNPIWQVSLDKGSHPSDPAFAKTDDSTAYILLTTIEANSGGMWIWKIESETGDSSWDGGLSLNNIDGDNNVPHIRLPGPIIVNLDSDSVPEMIITIPTDADGSASADGAEYRGIEISDGEEIWSFNSVNGFADAPPTAIDSDSDGIYDRICWVTWWQTTTARHGEAGCHDVSGTIPDQIWNRDLEQSSGTPNDEIAVSAPTWMDIDGEDGQELLVAYGRSLWAFDGEEGTSTAINSEWSNEVELSHRTWSSPSLADIDGDATLDIVIGSMVVSTGIVDIRPLTDNRSIEFNPNEPDPGEKVTITAFFENSGTSTTEEGVDAVLYADGDEIGRYRSGNMQPIDPSGPGTFSSFDVEWEGDLGSHIFELKLDPYRNITQSRYDNDNQVKTLFIIPPYNASFEIPTDPIRVNPGESSIAIPTIRSTGRLPGTWSMNIDSSNLPVGWSWNEVSGSELEGVEIKVGETWRPEISINAPNDALGSDSGFLVLNLVLDANNNISVDATLPIEANRTRGLSLRGPDGTSFTEGYGLIGSYAAAWLMIENVGNAAENQITISWDNTDWGSDLKLFNSQDVEETALLLGPGETKEMAAKLMIPSDAEYEETVSTPLTMCVGNGEEEICQTIILSFEVSIVLFENNHQRSVPSEGLQWTIIADIPSDEEYLNWSLADSGMAINGWSWNTTGEVSIIGGMISIEGTPGSRSTGVLYLDLPDNSPPMYHLFSSSSGPLGSNLKFSLEVLQIYRASLTITSPTEIPSFADIGEEKVAILRLENPGNGRDSFDLSHNIILDQNITSDPGIIITFSNNPISLEAGSLKAIPITIVIPPSTPARVDINIEIIMTSRGDTIITDSKILVIQARQNHVWSIDAKIDGNEVSGNEYTINPGDTLQVEVNAQNLGNMIDDIELIAITELSLEPNDLVAGWLATGEARTGVGVNGTVNMQVNATISEGALVGSIMIVKIIAVSGEDEVGVFSFEIGVKHSPGWTVVANDADLEIGNNGSGVELTIVQLGNMASRPYVSVWIVGENGWTVLAPNELPMITPGGISEMILNVTPPDNAQYGKSVELHVKVREGDSSVSSEITLPLRVSAIYNFTMVKHDSWILSPTGGYALVSLENHGNSPTTISLQILSLPQGWNMSGPTKIVLSNNEKSGLPLEIIPSEDWDGSIKTIRILAEDGRGNQQEIFIDTKFSDYSWGSSPFINSYLGDNAVINIRGVDQNQDTIIGEQGSELQWTEQGWLLPTGALNSITYGNITINEGDKLPYILETYQINKRSVTCQISGIVGDVHSSCSIGPGNTSFEYTMLLTDDKGVIIDSKFGILNNFQQITNINLSSIHWEPSPGIRTLEIRIIDSKGHEIGNYQKDFEIRKNNWNLGLTSIELIGTGNNQIIAITAERFGHSQLIDADCTITLTAGEYESVQKIDMSTREALTPKPKFERPMGIEDGTEIIVRINCAFPWEIDANQADNEIRKVLTGGAIDNERSIFTPLSLVTAFAIIILYIVFSWILKNRRDMKELEEMTERAIKDKLYISGKPNEDKIKKEIPVIKEEILAREEKYIGIEEDNPEGEILDDKEENEDEEILDDFERRLKRIRRDE